MNKYKFKIYIIILLIALLTLGVFRAPSYIKGSSRNAIALACAIAHIAHKQTGLVLNREISDFLSPDTEFHITDKVIKTALDKYPANYAGNDKCAIFSDDLGQPILYIAAFKIFGMKILSLATFIAAVIFVLACVFLLRFREDIIADLLAISYVVSLSIAAGEGFNNENTYGAHGIAYLALFAMIYWLYSFYYAINHDRLSIDWVFDIIMGLATTFFLLCRATVKIQILAIIVIAGILFYKNKKKILSLGKTFSFFSPLIALLAAILISTTILKLSLHSYYEKSAQKHPFWHTIYVSLGVYPNKYGISYDDRIAIKRARESKYNRQGDNLQLFTREYEEILKKETIDIFKKDPYFVIKTFLIKIYFMFHILIENVSSFNIWFFISLTASLIMAYISGLGLSIKDWKKYGFLCLPLFFLPIEPFLAHPIFCKEVFMYLVILSVFILFYLAGSFYTKTTNQTKMAG